MNRPPSQSSGSTSAPRWPVWTLAALLALLWFGNLGLRALTEPDEGRYAEIPREMVVSGDWVIPHLNGIPYLEKPPLQYWATAALYKLLGVHPWVSRMYTAVLGFASLLLVGFAGTRFFGPVTGLYAALILASTALFYVLAHVNLLDMGLTFYLTAAMVALLLGQAEPTNAWRLRRWMWLAWVALGLAVLQKGLVGLVLPGFAVALFVLWQRDWQLLLRLQLLPGLLIVLTLNLPWWWLAQQRNPAFFDFFFVHEHFKRFLTDEAERVQPWWYFSVLLLLGCLPWVAPIARGFLLALRRPSTTARGFATQRFIAVWAAAVFVFYSPSGSKLAPYILPMLPPLALLAGRYLSSRPLTVPALRTSWWSATMLGLLMCSLPLLVSHLGVALDRMSAYENIAQLGFLSGLLLLFAVALALLLERRRSRTAAVAVLATGWIASLALFSNGSNELQAWKGGTLLATDLAPHLRTGARFFCLDIYPQSTIFTLAQNCTVVGNAGELETQFDDKDINWLPTDAEFVAAWMAAPHAVAVVEPSSIAKWQSLAIGATVVVSKPYGVVLVK